MFKISKIDCRLKQLKIGLDSSSLSCSSNDSDHFSTIGENRIASIGHWPNHLHY